MTLPPVSESVPRILYPMMVQHPAALERAHDTGAGEIRDQRLSDLAAILKALPAPERTKLLAPFRDGLAAAEETIRALTEERDRLSAERHAAAEAIVTTVGWRDGEQAGFAHTAERIREPRGVDVQ